MSMFSKNLEILLKYIECLAKQDNVFIRIHDYDGFIANDRIEIKTTFEEYPPFCSYLRGSDKTFQHCLAKEKDIIEHCKKHGAFYGMCYAGVESLTVPFFYDDKLLGFISAGRYRGEHKEAVSRLNRIHDEFGLDKNTLYSKYFDTLERCPERFKELEPKIKIIALTLELLRNEFSQQSVLQGPTDDKDVLCRKIIEYINLAYMTQLSLSTFASYFNCSTSLISHCFKQHTNMSIKEYINQVRLDKAVEILSNTTASINSISRSVGFDNTNHFIKLFKLKYGITPGEYRKQL